MFEEGIPPPSIFNDDFLAFRKEHRDRVDQSLILRFGKSAIEKNWAAALLVEKSLAGKLDAEWFELGFVCPVKKWAEQCSSWKTAQIKASLLSPNQQVTDLTGGLGIDSIAFATIAQHIQYAEKSQSLCEYFEQNIQRLQIENISTFHRDGLNCIPESSADNIVLYADPDRRGKDGRRLVDPESMSPPWSSLRELANQGHSLIIKFSPLHDLKRLISEHPQADAIHLTEFNGECKEILAEWQAPPDRRSRLFIHREEQTIKLDIKQIHSAAPDIAAEPSSFLFIPSPALMKAGPWDWFCRIFNIKKLASNTHIFTSTEPKPGFPGRQFRLLQPFHKRIGLKAATVISLNHPLSANQIRERYRLKEDESICLIAFRDGGGKSKMWIAEKHI